MVTGDKTIDDILVLSPVVPVLSIADLEQAVPLVGALRSGGLRVIEITLRTACALDAIRLIADNLKDVFVGAGTVVTAEDLALAESAGAQFAVSPGTTDALLRAAAQSSLPFLPGIATASEILRAQEHGFTTVKFFPAEAAGGVAMLKAFAGPFPGVKFCPTGGVREGNFRDYLKLENVIAVGGTWLAPSDRVKGADWEMIRLLAEQASKPAIN